MSPALAALLSACGQPEPAPPVTLTVLAASSLTDVLPRVAEAWSSSSSKADGATVTFGFDSSSRLTKQVEAGAPADLLFTADRESMDTVDQKGLLVSGTRRDLLGNSLVLVVPTTADWTPSSASDLGAASLGHLAVAGENVPAGKYARAALAAAGVWTQVEPLVVSGDTVRTTLAWVARGEADAGVVYTTDAKTEPGVRVAFVFPEESHPPIVYPAAVVSRSEHPEEAASFLAFCASPAGMAIFAEAGFTPPAPPR